jgi:hypothetical protein
MSHPVPNVCLPLEYQEVMVVRLRALIQDMAHLAEVSDDCVYSDALYICQMHFGLLPPAPESEAL